VSSNFIVKSVLDYVAVTEYIRVRVSIRITFSIVTDGGVCTSGDWVFPKRRNSFGQRLNRRRAKKKIRSGVVPVTLVSFGAFPDRPYKTRNDLYRGRYVRPTSRKRTSVFTRAPVMAWDGEGCNRFVTDFTLANVENRARYRVFFET